MNTTASPTSSLDRFFGALRQSTLRRSTTDRKVAGVCAGIAERFGIAPAVVRIAAVVLAVLGVGVTLYLLAWFLLPDTAGSLHVERALRDGHGGSILLGVLALLAILPDAHPLSSIWTVAIAVAAIAAFVALTRNHNSTPTHGGPTASTPTSPTTPQDAPRW